MRYVAVPSVVADVDGSVCTEVCISAGAVESKPEVSMGVYEEECGQTCILLSSDVGVGLDDDGSFQK